MLRSLRTVGPLRALRSIPVPIYRLPIPLQATVPLPKLTHCGSRFLTTSRSLYAQAAAQRVVATEEDVAETFEDAESTPKTYSSIEDALHPAVYKAITQKPFQYSTMTEVQAAVLSLLPRLSCSPSPTPLATTAADSPNELQQAQDLLVRAKTGTGKTLAFLIPALEGRLRELESFQTKFSLENPNATSQEKRAALADYTRSTVGALIMSPTRELATQIANEAKALTSHLPNFGVRLWVGGASRSLQYREFSRSASNDIVVTTPGRCVDFLNSEKSIAGPISKARMLILDEADTLLDMGFSEDINTVTSYLPDNNNRQTFLFSATVSKNIRQIARQSLKTDHVFVDTVKPDEVDTHLHIPQYHTILPSPQDQIVHILRLIAHDQLIHARTAAENGGKKAGKAVIFLPTTRLTQLMSLILSSMKNYLPWARDTQIIEIHSKKDQNQRTRASEKFRSQQTGYSILVTSDVSARGVDYPGVTRVIQVGVPGTRDLYIHRVGRTGRAGKMGRGDLVLLPFEAGFVKGELRDIPLQPNTVGDTQRDLLAVTEDWDNNPTQFTPTEEENSAANSSRSKSRFGKNRKEFAAPNRIVSISNPVAPRLEGLQDSLLNSVLPALDAQDVEEAFSSLLGYYMGKSSELRTSKEEILDGLKSWATGAAGLESEPYVSPAFLKKVGFGSGGGKRRGNDSFGRKGGFGRSESSSRVGFSASRSRDDRGGDYSPRSFDRNDRRPSSRSFDRNDRAPRSFGGRNSDDSENSSSRYFDTPDRSRGTSRKPSFGYGGSDNLYGTNDADSWEKPRRRERY